MSFWIQKTIQNSLKRVFRALLKHTRHMHQINSLS
ncbi:hypothetical protein Makalu002_071 [Escherichia phage Ec_Makalu_002]|uniref:Uncharacterized protein n=1 Tax=Escherichia phage Ec_Makalu_002 TaxID=2682770 RepID=A0A650DGB4_9CAUD|nr:hypothetical protein Makalu002_071 [Escherichia phage Ec_Makalu_002]